MNGFGKKKLTRFFPLKHFLDAYANRRQTYPQRYTYVRKNNVDLPTKKRVGVHFFFKYLALGYQNIKRRLRRLIRSFSKQYCVSISCNSERSIISTCTNYEKTNNVINLCI